jgi:uncharacterized protein YqgC (DUF456 family)
MLDRLRRTTGRGKYAAIGAAIGAGLGGLFSRSAASTGGAVGGLVGAVVGEQRATADAIIERVNPRPPE